MVSELPLQSVQYNLQRCLNPCFSGGWSRSEVYACAEAVFDDVLILVLVEDGLGAQAALDELFG